MAVIEIPVNPNLESQEFQIILDAVVYTLKFSWNTRQQSWGMDIYETSTNTLLIQGIKIEVDWMPVFRYQIENFPPGDFIVIDTSGLQVPPERTEFGTDARVKLMYNEATT